MRSDVGGVCKLMVDTENPGCPHCGEELDNLIAYVRGHRTSDGYECPDCNEWWDYQEWFDKFGEPDE